ncbi:hypothetical protein Aduo_014247 [Ancylostoma duodenale]
MAASCCCSYFDRQPTNTRREAPKNNGYSLEQLGADLRTYPQRTYQRQEQRTSDLALGEFSTMAAVAAVKKLERQGVIRVDFSALKRRKTTDACPRAGWLAGPPPRRRRS